MKQNFRIVRLLAFVVLLLFGACSNATQSKLAAGGGVPVIGADVTNHDFGMVDEGTKVEYVFKIQNKGDGVLKIKKATGS